MTAVVGAAASEENNAAGLFSNINWFAWLAYFLWVSADVSGPHVSATSKVASPRFEPA